MQLGVIKNGDSLATVQFLDIKPGHDLPDLLLQAAKALGLRTVKRFYTQQGGEIEELREILPGDILYVSSGEKFISPPREPEYNQFHPPEPNNGFPFHPPAPFPPAAAAAAAAASSKKPEEKKAAANKKEEYHKVVMSLSETFPDEPMNMLAAATIVAEGKIEAAALLLLERPYNPEVLKQKQILDNKLAPADMHVKDSPSLAPTKVSSTAGYSSPLAAIPVNSAVGALPFTMPFTGEIPKAKPTASSSSAPALSPSLLSSALGPLPVSSAPSASAPPFEFSSQLHQLQAKFNLIGDDLKRAQQMLINYKGDVEPVATKLTALGLAKTVPPSPSPPPSATPLAVLNSDAPNSLPAPLVPEAPHAAMSVKISTPEKKQ